jgi:hypothetical protein
MFLIQHLRRHKTRKTKVFSDSALSLYCPVNEDVFHVRFKVFTAASMKFRVFWDVAPCSHVETTDVSEVLTASIIRAMNNNNNNNNNATS